ncbi:MAG: hypothetical protein ACLFST_14450 [Spirochaetia bacterium]
MVLHEVCRRKNQLGGGLNGSAGGLQVGAWDMDMDYSSRYTLGFRLCRTADRGALRTRKCRGWDSRASQPGLVNV